MTRDANKDPRGRLYKKAIAAKHASTRMLRSYLGMPDPVVGRAASPVVPAALRGDGRGELAAAAAQLLPEAQGEAAHHGEQAPSAVDDSDEFIREHFPARAAEIDIGEPADDTAPPPAPVAASEPMIGARTSRSPHTNSSAAPLPDSAAPPPAPAPTAESVGDNDETVDVGNAEDEREQQQDNEEGVESYPEEPVNNASFDYDIVASLDAADDHDTRDMAVLDLNDGLCTPSKHHAPLGIQQKLLWAVQNRLRLELQPPNRTKKDSVIVDKWLLRHLRKHNWWIRREHAHDISARLESCNRGL